MTQITDSDPTAHGTFEIDLTPGPAELGGRIARFDFVKTFHGDLAGTGTGLMLSGGDPARQTAGYVAIETVTGRLHGATGGFALQQFATMTTGETTLRYCIVPGSGHGELEGITGDLDLTVDPDGTHRYALGYALDRAAAHGDTGP